MTLIRVGSFRDFWTLFNVKLFSTIQTLNSSQYLSSADLLQPSKCFTGIPWSCSVVVLSTIISWETKKELYRSTRSKIGRCNFNGDSGKNIALLEKSPLESSETLQTMSFSKNKYKHLTNARFKLLYFFKKSRHVS